MLAQPTGLQPTGKPDAEDRREPARSNPDPDEHLVRSVVSIAEEDSATEGQERKAHW